MPTVDLVVALGKNWRVAPRLSIESEMVAIAAGHLLSTGVARSVLFSGGKTAGTELPAEASVMAEYVRRRFKDHITHDRIVLEDESRDTAENAEMVCTFLADRDYPRIGLLTTASHLPAARRLFAAYSVAVSGEYSAESVLLARSARYASVIHRYQRSPLHRWHLVFEGTRSLILRADRKGRGVRTITRRTRPR